MTGSTDIYEFILNNIQKIVVPEELIRLEMSLSRFELVALLMVERNRHATMSRLAQGIAVPMSTATGIVDRLVGKGLLERGRSNEDRRVVTVSLTDKGNKMVGDVNKHFRQFIERIRSVITDDEFETAVRIVKKVVLGLQDNWNNPGDSGTVRRKTIKIE